MSEQQKNYWVLAYYGFKPVADPHAEVARHKKFFDQRDMSCRIYISEQGINGQASGYHVHAQEYIDWMNTREEFKEIQFKIHHHHENAFPRKTIKYRKQLVAIDTQVDLTKRGEHVSPAQWKELLNSEKRKILLDVRNEYEWKVGRFEGAELPPCDTFREFVAYADNLKKTVDVEKTPVMMYCTGGIRCELYSSILKERGFNTVYQLDGGVIGYGLKEGSAHWLGKLFVFDDRLTVPLDPNSQAPVIGKCHHCSTPVENYYNCANMDCNELFLCCPECFKAYSGCCCEACLNAPRLRPHQPQDSHKPFRRKSTLTGIASNKRAREAGDISANKGAGDIGD